MYEVPYRSGRTRARRKSDRTAILVIGSVITGVAFLVLVTIVMINGSPATHRNQNSDQAKLEKVMLPYADLIDIDWVEVDGNNVYFGFSSVHDDIEAVTRAAAMRGNRETNFGVHVWAVPAESKGWRPGAGRYYGSATARSGKAEWSAPSR